MPTPTSGTAAYGTLLKLGDAGGPETFTTVAEITDVELPEIKLDSEDATSHDSNGWEEVIATILSGGEPSFKANWLPTNATQNESTGVAYVILNRLKRNWRITLPGSVKTFNFAAIVSSFKPGAPLKGKLQVEFKLKISGPVTIS